MSINSTKLLSFGAALLALSSISGAAHATQGSNVMDSIMDRLINPSKYQLNSGDWQDGVCGEFNYAPTSTPAVERLMCGGDQAVGLMARPLLQPVICSERCTGDQGKAVQARLATNSITLLRNNGGSDRSCDTKIGGEDWENVIRTIYAGADGSGSAEACSAPERVALLNNWSNLWANGCTEEPSPCNEVHHLFRPDENSGMGQVFAFFLGIRNYCNGGSQEDNDPIRRPCRRDERYCPNGQDLGVVLPVKIPVPTEIPDNYFAGINNTQPCARGVFGFSIGSPSVLAAGQCPDGTNPFAGFLCIYPQDAQGRFGCNNNRFGASIFNFNMDGRLYNEIPLDDKAREVFPAGSNVGDWREFYRLHAGCKDGGRDNSELLGCMVRKSQCSIGWGSMRIQKETGESLGVAIAELNDLPINQRGYPFNQFLYLSTINGFDTATGEEAKLVDCVRNHPDRVAAAVADAGFLPFPTVAERPVTCDSPDPQ